MNQFPLIMKISVWLGVSNHNSYLLNNNTANLYITASLPLATATIDMSLVLRVFDHAIFVLLEHACICTFSYVATTVRIPWNCM